MDRPSENGKSNIAASFISKSSLIALIVGLLLFLVFMISFFENRKNGELMKESASQEYPIVAMGDSLLAMYSDERSLVKGIAGLSGLEIFDASFGGTTLANCNRDGRLDMGKDLYSFAGLSRAISTQDFRLQTGTLVRESATLYFPERLKALSEVDFSKTKLLILEYGVNDYQMGVPLSCGNDKYDAYSYEGAYRRGIEGLRKAYPELEILILSPTFIWYPDMLLDGESRDFGYGGINGYADVASSIAKEQGVYFLDLYYDFYPHGDAEDWKINTDDGMHPNKNGRAMIAQKVATWLRDWDNNQIKD